MLIRIEGYDPPASESPYVWVGIQRLSEVEQIRPADSARFTWQAETTVHHDAQGRIDLRGPYVHGRRGDRFLYLSWGTFDRGGTVTMFRRAKLMLAAVDDATIEAAESSGRPLVGRLSLTGKDGTPVCAAVRPPAIAWSLG